MARRLRGRERLPSTTDPALNNGTRANLILEVPACGETPNGTPELSAQKHAAQALICMSEATGTQRARPAKDLTIVASPGRLSRGQDPSWVSTCVN